MKIRVRIVFTYSVLSGLILLFFSLFILLAAQNISNTALDQEVSLTAKDIIKVFELDGKAAFQAPKETDDLSWMDSKWVKILSPDLKEIFATTYAKRNPLVLDQNPDTEKTFTVEAASNALLNNLDFRVDMVPVKFENKVHYFVITAAQTDSYKKTFRSIQLAITAGFILFLAFVILVGYLFSRQVLHPLTLITQAAKRIHSSNLSERIVVQNNRDELGLLTEEINRLLERIEKSFLAQKQFLSDAAHELKTPLSIIRMRIETEMNSTETESSEETYYKILETVVFLQNLVGKLLLLARLEEQTAIPVERVSIQKILQRLYDSLLPLAEVKNLHFSLDADSPEVFISADREWIYTAFFNIVENAVKFTEAGSVTLSYNTEADKIIIIVEDTGIGIEPKFQEKIFDRFYRIPGSPNSSRPGSGIGLSISKKIIELFGGNIRVESAKNKGCRFVITFPLK